MIRDSGSGGSRSNPWILKEHIYPPRASAPASFHFDLSFFGVETCTVPYLPIYIATSTMAASPPPEASIDDDPPLAMDPPPSDKAVKPASHGCSTPRIPAAVHTAQRLALADTHAAVWNAEVICCTRSS